MIKEFLIIFVLNYVGIIISQIFKIPIPGTIIGMLLLFILLYTGTLKLSATEKAGNFLLVNMTIFFLPSSVKILDSIFLLKNNIFKILILVIVSTVLTMIVTAKTVEFLIKRKEGKNGSIN